MADDIQADTSQDTPCLLYRLPDELLLNVALCLPQPDLCRLSLVSKQIGSVVQESLYRSPSIICVSNGPSRIAMLAATLACHPDLAYKVNELIVMPHIRQVRVIISMFHAQSKPNTPTTPALKTLSIFMKETEVLGYLLNLS